MIASHSFRAGLWLVLAAIWLSSAAQHLTRDSNRARQVSNAAFNDGRLRDAIEAAQRASRAWLPGSQSARQAEDRLHAIAVGAEATGRRKTALLAWSCMAAVQSDLGGIGSSKPGGHREAAQHIEGLLPTRKGEKRDVETVPRGRPVLTSGGTSQREPEVSAALFLVATVLVTLIVFSYDAAASGFGRLARGRFTGWLLLAAAGGAWCVGWMLV
jgi:hypothetical protein